MMKRFIFDIEISGTGHIEVIAANKDKAVENLEAGNGIQHCNEWECADYSKEPSDMNGEDVNQNEIYKYLDETDII